MSDFDLEKGKGLKEQGINLAADSKNESLNFARQVARFIAKNTPGRLCDADAVQKELIPCGIDLGNAAGALFKEKCWEWTGQFKQSHRVANHARLIRIWRLRESYD